MSSIPSTPVGFALGVTTPAQPVDATSDDALGAVRWPRVLAVAAAFFLVFYTVEHNPASFAGLQVADHTEDRIKDTYIDSIEDGNSMRKLVITSYGLAGLSPWPPAVHDAGTCSAWALACWR